MTIIKDVKLSMLPPYLFRYLNIITFYWFGKGGLKNTFLHFCVYGSILFIAVGYAFFQGKELFQFSPLLFVILLILYYILATIWALYTQIAVFNASIYKRDFKTVEKCYAFLGSMPIFVLSLIGGVSIVIAVVYYYFYYFFVYDKMLQPNKDYKTF